MKKRLAISIVAASLLISSLAVPASARWLPAPRERATCTRTYSDGRVNTYTAGPGAKGTTQYYEWEEGWPSTTGWVRIVCV